MGKQRQVPMRKQQRRGCFYIDILNAQVVVWDKRLWKRTERCQSSISQSQKGIYLVSGIARFCKSMSLQQHPEWWLGRGMRALKRTHRSEERRVGKEGRY